MFLGPMSWSEGLLIFFLHVYALIKQVFDDVVPLVLDGIVKWTLQLVVDMIVMSSITH